MIIVVYTNQPTFPPSLQHPNADRVQLNGYWVDYIGGPVPTLQDVTAFLTPKVKRPLLDIVTDVSALSGPRKNAIWTDFTSGSPQKWMADTGPNAAALAVLHLMAVDLGLSAAAILQAKVRAVAMYVQDNPAYLVNPSFAPTLNIPGVQ